MPRKNLTIDTTIAMNEIDSDAMWRELEQLNNIRNELSYVFEEIMHQIKHFYQPVCLKDYYLYFYRTEFLKHIASMDCCLDKMEEVLSQVNAEWKTTFFLKKIEFNAFMEDIKQFLENLSREAKKRVDTIPFFKATEVCKNKLGKINPNSRNYEAIKIKAINFIEYVDVYRKYFNSYVVLPETRQIRDLLQKIEASDQDVQSMDFSADLRRLVSSLEFKIDNAKILCAAKMDEVNWEFYLVERDNSNLFFIPSNDANRNTRQQSCSEIHSTLLA